MHQVDELNDPVVENGLVLGWEEGVELPVHDSVEMLDFSFDDFLACFSAIIKFIVPYEVVPVFLDVQIKKVERWLGFDGLEDILTVRECVADFCFSGLQKQAIGVGEDNV